MFRRRWMLTLVLRALVYRRGRTVLLLAVLAMASSLVAALGIVSDSMGRRVAEEIGKYGANLVVMPPDARIEVGSGGLNFGAIREPSYLDQQRVTDALTGSGLRAERSLHLRGLLHWRDADIMAEGVNFPEIRRLFPWWQLRGAWPQAGEALVGVDLAARFGLQPGDLLELAGASRHLRTRVSGIVTSGGEEDALLFLELPELQTALGLENRVSLVRLLVTVGRDRPSDAAAALQPLLTGATVREVRQVARTSENLLAKVKLLMSLVTAVVLVCAGSSVAGTMSTTVLERGREIGLMKAMGAGRWEVLLIFFGESLLLGVSGGVAGYLAGIGIAQFVTRTIFAAPAGVIPVFAVASVGVSVMIAIMGSVGPMMAVFRLDPVISLRGE
jgi:putative ABC transport system permease protein